MKHYSPTGRRNHGRPLKRFLDTWDRNGSTSGPTPWQIYDDELISYYLQSKMIYDSTFRCLILPHYILLQCLNHTAFLLSSWYSKFSLTPRSSHSWQINNSRLVEKYPMFNRTRTFITVFITACHLSLSWGR
jgi:hypothetical protein